MSTSTTLSVKVSTSFAKKFRKFCEKNCLQVGKFTEQVLEEIIEDHYFGIKAQKILSQSDEKKLGQSAIKKLAQ